MIGIVDYGVGNLLSVFHAVRTLGIDAKICQHPEELKEADKIILPGVGAFQQCMDTLTQKGFVEALNEAVIQEGKFILGICLGMQVMANGSEEGGDAKGLGWFDAEVVKLSPTEEKLRIPHMGWNAVEYDATCPLFTSISPEKSDFYFVHSYHVKCKNPQDVKAISHYGQKVTAVIQKNNIFAAQFHPEKSQDVGLKFLENFLQLS